MKKQLFFLLSIFLLALTALSVNAMPEYPTSFVTGTVYLGSISDGNEVGGATVSATCNGITTVPVKTFNSTRNRGDYLIYFYNHDCDEGEVTVNATYLGKSGSFTDEMTPDGMSMMSFAIVDISIPEFSAITASIAVIAGAMIFVYYRKRN